MDGAIGIAGVLYVGCIGVLEGRPNQLHCRQPVIPTTNADTIVKTSSLFITVVSYQKMIERLRTNQQSNSTPHLAPGKDH
jgi:hypothetical protein